MRSKSMASRAFAHSSILWRISPLGLLAAFLGTGFHLQALAAEAQETQGQDLPKLYIREYRVKGSHILPAIEIQKAVYPFLGPERTTDDVEQARAALEKAYKEKGYQTVAVEIPQQSGRGGFVTLQVVEGKVGHLRVKGARWFIPSDIKKAVPSLAEGKVPNFNDLTKEIVALQTGDRQVTPVLRPGEEPGLVDFDLNVTDKQPLHGSVEFNNRYSPNTTHERINGSISDTNLWQLGHSIGFSFQVAPENVNDAEVFSAFYTLPVPSVDWLSLMLEGTKQNSNVSTLGGAAVAGRGNIIGLRALITLPTEPGFYQSLSLGFDYKHFDQNVILGAVVQATPIDYYPLSLNYGASWTHKTGFTEFNTSINFAFRGVGSGPDKFDAKRYNADGSYLYVRSDLSHTQDLPWGFQLFGKLQGQLSDSPLINSEQCAGGGLNNVRGYLESSVLGDNGLFGTVELRSPSLLAWINKKGDEKAYEWRFYGFMDGGRLTLNDALPEQKTRFDLASYGVGSRIKLLNFLNASVDAAKPLVSQAPTIAGDIFYSFRVWAEF